MRDGGAIAGIEWATAGRPVAGESVSGDLALCLSLPGGALLALIDGLGHGLAAEEVARQAAEELRADPAAEIGELFARCHHRLHRSRGVVLTIAAVDLGAQRVRWAGIGNVEAIIVRAGAGLPRRDSLNLRGGVIGGEHPPPRVADLPFSTGDLVILASDGLRPHFAGAVDVHAPPRRIADALLETFARPQDDALVLVARSLGAAR